MSRVLDNTRESLFDSASVVILSTFTFVSSRRSQLNTHFLRTSSKHTVISRRCVSGLPVLGERVLTPSLPFPRSTSFLDCYFWLTSRLSNECSCNFSAISKTSTAGNWPTATTVYRHDTASNVRFTKSWRLLPISSIPSFPADGTPAPTHHHGGSHLGATRVVGSWV